MTTIAIRGLGEAGQLYARGLRAAGAEVRVFDPFHERHDPEIRQVPTLGEALREADVVLSLVGGVAALAAATQALPHAGADTVFADLNTAAPAVKEQIAVAADRAGVPMADVAILAPVPRAAPARMRSPSASARSECRSWCSTAARGRPRDSACCAASS